MKNALRGPGDRGRERRLLFPGLGTCQAHAEVAGASIEVRRFRWRGRPHTGSFAVTTRFIELTDIRACGGYSAAEREWRSLGPVRFYPGDRRFYSRWFGDEQTSLLCAFDLKRMLGVDLSIDEPHLADCVDIRNAHLHALLIRIKAELLSPGFMSGLILEAACMGAVAEIARHFGGSTDHAHGRGEKIAPAKIEQIGHGIRSGEIPASLRALADQEGVSIRQYTRLFHASAGETVGRFCARQLTLRAKDLLADRSLLIKEVAFRCGFSSTASFTRAFRRETGLYPTQYRDWLGR